MGNEDKECGFGREILPEATQDEVKQKVPQGEQPGTQGTEAPRGGGAGGSTDAASRSARCAER